VASPGHLLVELDYSQLELRIAAALSGDPVMIADFLSGEDFHLRTAKAIAKTFWGIPPEQVEKKHRTLAKSVNFGLAYGKTARTFSEELGIPVEDAERLCDAIMGRFKVFTAWRNERLAYARRSGFCWTEWRGRQARRRALWNLGGQDDYLRSVAEHGSYNTPVQGTASDYCVASIVSVVRWIEDNALAPDVMLVLPVHDSLMLDVREDLVPEAVSAVSGIVTSWPIPNGVPLEAEVKVGPSWGSLAKWVAPNSTAHA
jgi:DNA polymerase-1